MTIIYLQTGKPGEGDEALAHAEKAEMRTARGYSGPTDAEVVYTDDPEIQEDYQGKAEVFTLDAEPVERGLESMSFDELYEKTQELEIEGRSHMDKGEMREAIRNAQNDS